LKGKSKKLWRAEWLQEKEINRVERWMAIGIYMGCGSLNSSIFSAKVF